MVSEMALASQGVGVNWRRLTSLTMTYLAVAGIALFILVPVYFLFILAFMPKAEVYSWPLPLFPQHFTLDNFRFFLTINPKIIPSIWRSIEVALTTILIALSIGGLAGYSFARFRFRGKNALKLSVLFVRMYPGVAVAIPMAVLFMRLGLYDTPFPIALALNYGVGNIGLTIWITASIFLGINEELEEQAMVLGLSRMGAFFRITLPLAAPGLAAAAIYTFIGAWNEVVIATLMTQFNPTLAAVTYHTVAAAAGSLHLQSAGGAFMAFPALIFTFIIKRYIIQMWGGVRI